MNGHRRGHCPCIEFASIDFLAKAEFLRPVRHLDMRRSVQIDCLKIDLPI
jgi:hypothetical protein